MILRLPKIIQLSWWDGRSGRLVVASRHVDARVGTVSTFTSTMSPRFPQELFDHIIDYAEDDDNALKTYSTVCKRWTARSHSHLFNLLCIWEPADLDRWCEGIPPTIDGPSKYVKDLYVCVGTIPFVGEPQSLDPYLDHLSAFTRVVDLTLVGDDVKVHLDTAFQGFSAFRDTLRRLKLQSTSFRFEEVSRIVEFFPNLLALMMLSPMSLPSDKMGEFPPHQRATFPKLQGLEFRPCSKSQPLDHDLLSGFAEASMDLQCLSVVGEVSDPSAVKQLVESSAHSLLELEVSSFGKYCSWRHAHAVLMIHPPVARRTGSHRVRKYPVSRSSRSIAFILRFPLSPRFPH